MRLRSRLAIHCAKITGAVIRKTGRGNASVLPGHVAKRIDPEILSVMSGMVRKKIIAVTGTNGKTTVNRMLMHALETQGERVVGNAFGANMEEGIIAAFVLAADKRGRLNADYACIETDEEATVSIFPKMKPACVLITNLFRDQLDRAGEVEMVRDRLKEAIESVPEAIPVINGDDVCSYTLIAESGRHGVICGVSEKIADGIPEGPTEGIFCPVCGRKLWYELIQYGQLGIWQCPGCGLKRPRPDVTAGGISFQEGNCSFTLEGMNITAGTSAPYSVYNILSAYAVLCAADAPREGFWKAVREYDFGNGRESVFQINDTRVSLWLAKNPIGFQQKLYLIMEDPDRKDILIGINDDEVDGADVSWLWDVDFRCLSESNVATVAVGGRRREDMGLCLKYNGISCRTAENVRETVETLTAGGTGNLYIITNYSGLHATGRMLGRLQAAEREGGRP